MTLYNPPGDLTPPPAPETNAGAKHSQPLSAQAYDEAIEAHRRGRDVEVIGVVERDNRGTFRIARVVDFRTL